MLALGIPQDLYAQDLNVGNETEYLKGKITEIVEQKQISFEGYDEPQLYQKIEILVTEGSLKDERIIVENGASPLAQVIEYSVGDRVMISYNQDLEGNDVFYIAEFIRTNGMIWLFAIFIILSVAIGAKKGLNSLISMALSFLILFTFVLPQIQNGRDPMWIAIAASVIIVPITFYMSHGIDRKTTVAVISTFIALIITGVLSVIFVKKAHLTGTSSEEAMFLQTLSGEPYNLQGLLLAGIIIGTLGVMDDITVSQTSIAFQLHALKNEISFKELFNRTIVVGKDHIASMINTLVLVYTGASMPLLLLFLDNPRPFDELINLELVATEIVRTFVGSIGLILAVPISTYLACYVAKKWGSGGAVEKDFTQHSH